MVVAREVGLDLGGHLEVSLVSVEVIEEVVHSRAIGVIVLAAKVKDGLIKILRVVDPSCQAKKHGALSAARNVTPFLME